MLLHILIPESQTYMTVAFILIALSNQAIISLVHARWLILKGFKVISVSTLFKGLIVAWGFYFIPINMLMQGFYATYFLSIFAGVILGYLSMRLEETLIRRWARSHLLNNTIVSVNNDLGSLLCGALFEPVLLKLSSNKVKKNRVSGIRQGSNNMLMSSESYHFLFLPLVLTALFEELIYRGFLPILCLELHCPILMIIAVIGVSLAFSFSHINFGALQVMTKIVFSFSMLISVILTHNLLTAISAHLCFNILTWRYLKGQSMINTRHRPEQIALLG